MSFGFLFVERFWGRGGLDFCFGFRFHFHFHFGFGVCEFVLDF